MGRKTRSRCRADPTAVTTWAIEQRVDNRLCASFWLCPLGGVG